MREYAQDYMRELVPIFDYLRQEGIPLDDVGGISLDNDNEYMEIRKITDENYKVTIGDNSFLTLDPKRFYDILTKVRKRYEYAFFQ